MKAIYLDYNATSPLRPEVRRTLTAFLDGEAWGNPSSLHALGRRARATVEEVRAGILKTLGDPKGDLLFTSGGTEADNFAVSGVVRALQGRGNHLVISSVEHSAVLQAAQALQEEGFRVTQVPVDSEGRVDPREVKEAITPRTLLVSVMHANNEVGTIQPIREIAQAARERQVLFHTDAVQSFGKVPLDVREVEADLVSLSAHKIGGPKGAGALYVRQGVRIRPLLRGGPHERNLRAGTEGVLGIIGLGAAARSALVGQRDGEPERIRGLRDRLEEGLLRQVPGAVRNGHATQRVPNTLNVSFPGCDGETLLMALDLAGVCVSTGSACSSGSTEPSHVLVAMGLPEERIRGSIRFSLGWDTAEEEIDEALERVPRVVKRVRLPRPPSADSQ